MSLQDQLVNDFAATLLDPDGPSQYVQINGIGCRAVVDQPGQTAIDSRSGLIIHRMTLYVLAQDLGYEPVAGQEIVLDGTTWYVETPSPHGSGVLQLGLYRFRG